MKKQQTPKNRKFVLVGVIILAILTIVGLSIVATVAMQQSKGALNQHKTTVLNMRGEAVCLPKKDMDAPQTQECAYGIKVSNGTYYALAKLDATNGSIPLQTGQTLLVSGTLLPADKDEIYNVAGTVEMYAVKLEE